MPDHHGGEKFVFATPAGWAPRDRRRDDPQQPITGGQMSAPRSPDTPFLGDGSDSFGPAERINTMAVVAPPGSEVGQLVTGAVAAMAAGGDSAEDSYQRALAALRERAGDAVTTLGATYESLEEDRYIERWSLVQLLNDLRLRESVAVLTEILRQPIPAERSSDPAHGLSTVGEEVIIRTTAVEALGRLLADGEGQARDALLEQVRHDVVSVRRAVIQAAVDSGDQRVRAAIVDALTGAPDEWLLGLRRVAVREVPQADGREFLRERDPEGSSTPPEPSN